MDDEMVMVVVAAVVACVATEVEKGGRWPGEKG